MTEKRTEGIMRPKRTTRNIVCWLLASVLILLGYVNRAKNESLQEGIITPIYFHNPNRRLFRKLVTWLKKNGYSFISCDQLTEILGTRIPCPRGAVWISLDDGWKGNIDNVIPTAVEYNIPITIFIYTASIEEGAFWWRKVRECANHLPAEFRRTKVIRRMPEDARKQIIELITQVEPQSASRREAMTVADVRKISAIPQVTIGSHTVTHPVLPNCNDSQIDYELRESKRKLEDWTGKPIRTFAYPNGYFDDRTRQWLRENGYELAATTQNKFARSNDDCYLLPRN